MKLSGSGRLMEVGDVSYNPFTGLQIRKASETSVVQEIGNLRKWRRFKAAQERNLRQPIPDPPVSPLVAEKQIRAAENFGCAKKGER